LDIFYCLIPCIQIKLEPNGGGPVAQRGLGGEILSGLGGPAAMMEASRHLLYGNLFLFQGIFYCWWGSILRFYWFN